MWSKLVIGVVAALAVTVSAQPGSIRNDGGDVIIAPGAPTGDVVFGTLGSVKAILAGVDERVTKEAAATTRGELVIEFETLINDSVVTIGDRIDKLAETAAEDDTKLEDKLTGVLADLVTAADAKHCQNGETWNDATGTCTGSPVLLSKSDIECTAATNGLMKLDPKGSMVVCKGDKKKFGAVSGGVGGVGLNVDTPANDCQAINVGIAFELKTGSKFWTKSTVDGKTSMQTACVFAGGSEPATTLGGDGTSAVNAAFSCFDLVDYFGKTEGKGDFYIKGQGKVECDFDLGAPSANSQNFGGASINNFVNMLKDYPKGYKGPVDILVRNADQYNKFKAGMWVIIHQTQHSDPNTVGQYEWNILRKDANNNKLEFVKPLKHNYKSGSYNKENGASRVVQILTVPYVNQARITSKLTAPKWDGYTGGIVALKAFTKLIVDAEINVNGMGFRGGDRQGGSGSCRAHSSAGDQGESYKGLGKRDGKSAGFSCCRGTSNAKTGFNGRGLSNGGGGGGGGGACHGGGGAGGGYGTFTGTPKCSNACGHKGDAGDGSPECYRAGSWSQRGSVYGDAQMTRPNLGSGGGGGNSYSPNSNENNAGGDGAGLVILDGGKEIRLGGVKIYANGMKGYPIDPGGRWKSCNTWKNSNPQDGSGGSGSGGGVLLSAGEKIDLNGANRVSVEGGVCGCDNGWRRRAQMGGAGGKGRIAAVSKSISGSSNYMTKVSP